MIRSLGLLVFQSISNGPMVFLNGISDNSTRMKLFVVPSLMNIS